MAEPRTPPLGLSHPTVRRFIKFALVGLSGVVVNLGCLWLLADVLQMRLVVAKAAAIELSIVWNFFLNDRYTFADRAETAQTTTLGRLARYNLVGLVGLAIQLGVSEGMDKLFMMAFSLPKPGAWKYVSQCGGIGVGMGWNFVSNFFRTWAQRDPDAQGESRG